MGWRASRPRGKPDRSKGTQFASRDRIAVKNERPAVLKYAILGLLWIAYLLNYVDRQMAFSWFPVLRQEVSFSETQLGLIGAVFLWSYSICAPFGGRISDLLSRRWITHASLADWSIAPNVPELSHS